MNLKPQIAAAVVCALVALTASATVLAAEPARAGTVLLVRADSAPADRYRGARHSPAVAISKIVGRATGRALGRDGGFYGGSVIGAVLGESVGRNIGRRAPPARVDGFTAIVRLENGRTVAVFMRRPRVRAGQQVWLVDDRLIVAGGGQ